MATYPECLVCLLVKSGMCTFILQLRKTSTRRSSDEGLNWGPFPPTEVDKIAQVINDGEEYPELLCVFYIHFNATMVDV